MIKKTVSFVVISIILSAGLLFLGISLMENYSPALASSPNALVAGTNGQNSLNTIPAGDRAPLTVDFVGEENKSEISPLPGAVSDLPASPVQPQVALVASILPGTPVDNVTIAPLLSNPKQFINKGITITGIATSLGSGKILLNDGTGQIQVEVDADMVNPADLNARFITVSGKLDDSSSQTGIHLDAYTIIDQNGTVFTDDCIDNPSSIDNHDCLNDNCSDDCLNDNCDDDCLNDNCDDDCLNDNCSDDCLNDNCDDDCLNDNCNDDCPKGDCSDKGDDSYDRNDDR